jgi:2-amino-4-hydroxy-6-hydroxymethyldihydropteridine diphosphokinase
MREAVRRIDAITPVLARSRIWETTPIGGPPQADFLNAAVRVAWTFAPIALLDGLMEIEADLGRVRSVKDGPRTIDLDILWIDGLVVDEPRLTVPHPRLHERAFAIAPLLDVAPDAVDSRTGRVYAVPSDQRIRLYDASL